MAPVEGEYFPEEQLKQAPTELYDPAGQVVSVHEEDPIDETFDAQAVQDPEEGRLKKPAPHSEQNAEPLLL